MEVRTCSPAVCCCNSHGRAMELQCGGVRWLCRPGPSKVSPLLSSPGYHRNSAVKLEIIMRHGGGKLML